MCNVSQSSDHSDALEPSHRKLGEHLGLFHFSESAPGSVFWHPAGFAVMEALSALWRELCAEFGMQEVRSPILYDAELWERSGHAEKFADLMYFLEADGRTLGLKPMNCPGHAEIYRQMPRSYRELPVRYCEQGVVHRLESSGNLNGVLRARQFVIDDAHLFCRPDQVGKELLSCLRMSRRIYDLLELEPRAELSLRPDQRLGSDKQWDAAEAALASALDGAGFAYDVRPGEGAFYGPKVDMHLDDRRGRSWQLATVQLDYQLPGRFDLAYRNEHNELVEPVMIHRASFGSFERFVGLLLDRLDGWFPLWLAPVGVAVLPVAEEHEEHAERVARALRDAGLRVEIRSGSGERLGARVRASHERRVPVVAVVGDQEARDGSVALRRRDGSQHVFNVDDAVVQLSHEMRERLMRPNAA